MIGFIIAANGIGMVDRFCEPDCGLERRCPVNNLSAPRLSIWSVIYRDPEWAIANGKARRDRGIHPLSALRFFCILLFLHAIRPVALILLLDGVAASRCESEPIEALRGYYIDSRRWYTHSHIFYGIDDRKREKKIANFSLNFCCLLSSSKKDFSLIIFAFCFFFLLFFSK